MSCSKECNKNDCCPCKAKLYKKFICKFEKAEIGKPAPCFKAQCYCPEKGIREFECKELKGKYAILVFYPLDWSFVCPTELRGFDMLRDQLKELDTQVIGISIDSPYCHQAWSKADLNDGGLGPIHFPLISDMTKTIGIKYGMLNHETGILRRGFVIIDDKGIVRYIQINDDGIGRSTEETVRIIQALKETDKNGVFCPVNWRPGFTTIIPK